MHSDKPEPSTTWSQNCFCVSVSICCKAVHVVDNVVKISRKCKLNALLIIFNNTTKFQTFKRPGDHIVHWSCWRKGKTVDHPTISSHRPTQSVGGLYSSTYRTMRSIAYSYKFSVCHNWSRVMEQDALSCRWILNFTSNKKRVQ